MQDALFFLLVLTQLETRCSVPFISYDELALLHDFVYALLTWNCSEFIVPYLSIST